MSKQVIIDITGASGAALGPRSLAARAIDLLQLSDQSKTAEWQGLAG